MIHPLIPMHTHFSHCFFTFCHVSLYPSLCLSVIFSLFSTSFFFDWFIDVNIQQATMNLLADMQCYPLTPDTPTLHVDVALSEKDKDKYKNKNRGSDNEDDITPPTSVLLFPVSDSKSNTVRKDASPSASTTTTHHFQGPIYIAQVHISI